MPLLSASEIALIVQLSRRLFVRIHTIVQLFLPLGLFDVFEEKNFLELTPPKNTLSKGEITEYIIAPNTETIIVYLKKTLPDTP